MLVASQGWELLCMLLSLGAYVAYHVWLFAFDTSVPGRFKVQDVAKRGRRIWARAIAEKDSETVTGVQTLRWVAASLCLWAKNLLAHMMHEHHKCIGTYQHTPQLLKCAHQQGKIGALLLTLVHLKQLPALWLGTLS